MDKCSNPKPISGPGIGDGSNVSPMKDGETLQVGWAKEAPLFNSLAKENVDIGGTPADYWFINSVDSPRDPLYGEPKERLFDGPFRFKVAFTAPNQTPIVREEGITANWDASVWIPRKTLEDIGTSLPAEGDIIHVWDLPMYVALSTMEPNPLPGAGYYFDVMNAQPDGYMADTAVFTGYKLDLKRRAEFTPERRLKRP